MPVSSVIFDLDGTLTKTPSPWRHVHERLGVWENVACTHLDKWLAGKICYEDFCRLSKGCEHNSEDENGVCHIESGIPSINLGKWGN